MQNRTCVSQLRMRAVPIRVKTPKQSVTPMRSLSTALGIKNLKRVADMLLPATSQPGEPYDDLEELYARMLGPVGH